MAVQIEKKYISVLIEAINERLYKISLELNKLKGQPLTKRRKELSEKQRQLEEVRTVLSMNK